MRIDLNSQTQPLPESNRTSNSSTAASSTASSTNSPLGDDQANLSGSHVQIQSLAAQVLQFPEVRQEKVNALRQVVLNGSYQPTSKQIANALLSHLSASPAA